MATDYQFPYSKSTRVNGEVIPASDHNKQELQIECVTDAIGNYDFTLGSLSTRMGIIESLGLSGILSIGNQTDGNDISITSGDSIVGAAELSLEATTIIQFSTNSIARWEIDANGHFWAENDNQYDIGSPDGGTTSNRPRTIYLGTSLIVGTSTISSGTVTSGASTLTFGALSNTIDLNDAVDATLGPTFSSTSLVGALNELKTTLDNLTLAEVLAIGNTTADGTNSNDIIISTGNSIVGETDLNLFAGDQVTDSGGDIFLIAGDSTSSDGGDIIIRGGSGSPNGTITIGDVNTTTTAIYAGTASDLTLGARSGTITLNEAGETTLDVAFVATSIIGGLNELRNDLDSLTLAQLLVVGNTTSDGTNSSDIIISTGDSIIGEAELTLTAGTNTAADNDLTLGARNTTITLNESGDESLGGTFTATSLIGALNEIKATTDTMSLAEVLTIGNTTSDGTNSSDIIVSTGDSITGETDLDLLAGTNSDVAVTANGSGAVNITGGGAVNISNGTTAGSINVSTVAGTSTSGITVITGNGSTSSGSISIVTGSGTNLAGAINITVGNCVSNGSDININAGDSSGATGGDINLNAGDGVTDGVVNIWGNLLFTSDATHDIGASGATRPNDVYIANSLNIGSGITPSTNNGDLVAGDGIRELFWDASTGILNLNGAAATTVGSTIATDAGDLTLDPADGDVIIADGNRLMLGDSGTNGAIVDFNGGTWLLVGNNSATLASMTTIMADLVDFSYGSGQDVTVTYLTGGVADHHHLFMGLGSGTAAAAYDLVVGPRSNINKNHHISTSANPTIRMYSTTDVDTDATEYSALRWDELAFNQAGSVNAGSSSDLTFGARSSTITLNESGDESLSGSFSATSIIGALNELKNVSVSGTIQKLTTVDSVDLTIASDVSMFTVSATSDPVVLTNVIFRCTSDDSIASEAWVSVGVDGDTGVDNLYNDQKLFGFLVTDDTYELIPGGKKVVINAGESVTLAINTAATDSGTGAPIQVASIDFFGYFVV